MTIQKIGLIVDKSNIQSAFDGQSITAIELGAAACGKVDEIVEVVNGVEQTAVEARAVVDNMELLQDQFLADNADTRTQIITENQEFIDTLTAAKTSFETDMTTALDTFETGLTASKTTFETNMTNTVNGIVASSQAIIQTDIDTKIGTIIADGTLSALINEELLGDVNTAIDTEETARTNQDNALNGLITAETEARTTLATDINNKITIEKTERESYGMTASALGCVDDGVTDCWALINGYLNGGENRTLILNGGKYKLSQPLVITQPNTYIEGLSNCRRKEKLSKSVLVAGHTGNVIDVQIPGYKGVFIKGIAIDGFNTAAKGIYLNDVFDRNFIRDVTIINCTTGLHVDENCYSLKCNNVFVYECDYALKVGSTSNYAVKFTDCQFIGRVIAATIGSDDNTDTNPLDLRFIGCDITSYTDNSIPLKIGKVDGLSFYGCYIEKDGISPVVVNAMVELGSANVLAGKVTFRDTILIANAKATHIFHWKNCYEVTIDNCEMNNFVSKLIDATDAMHVYPTNKFISHNAPVPSNSVNGKNINQLFHTWKGSNSANYPIDRVPYGVDTTQTGSTIGYKIHRYGETYSKAELREGGLYLGDGTLAHDVSFLRVATNVGGMNNGQHFKVDGSWNGGHLLLGGWHIWVDATGKLRILGSAPTGDTVGTVIGTQA